MNFSQTRPRRSSQETDASQPRATVPIHLLRVADPRSGAGRSSKHPTFNVDQKQPATGARLREAQHVGWNKVWEVPVKNLLTRFFKNEPPPRRVADFQIIVLLCQ
jgi:hypothetical protein